MDIEVVEPVFPRLPVEDVGERLLIAVTVVVLVGEPTDEGGEHVVERHVVDDVGEGLCLDGGDARALDDITDCGALLAAGPVMLEVFAPLLFERAEILSHISCIILLLLVWLYGVVIIRIVVWVLFHFLTLVVQGFFGRRMGIEDRYEYPVVVHRPLFLLKLHFLFFLRHT